MGHRLSKTAAVSQEAWSAPHAIFAVSPALMQGFSVTYRHQAGTKFPKSWSSCESRVSGSPFKLADIWIAIAMRPRNCLARQKLYWQPISGAPMSVQEAWCLADAGTLLVASRHQPDRVELVVRSRTPERTVDQPHAERSFSSAT
jgi:hypothetical protein